MMKRFIFLAFTICLIPALFSFTPIPVKKKAIKTIIIDPGHGGADEGSRGPSGSAEKQVTLAVARRLKAALEQLPEKQRLAIIMFTIEEMPQKQVAEALNCSVEAVKWHVFQGRKRLKELMKEYL